jgi:hypothetical protein
LNHFPGIFPAARYPIGIKALLKKISGKQFNQVIQWENAFFGFRLEPGPISNMLFRPEEIHGRSRKRDIFKPFSKGNGHIPHDAFRVSVQNFAITDIHRHGLSAIQTGCFDVYGFSGKKPADCQRFETSLAKPFLLTINRDAVLSGQVVKWCK